MMEQVANVVFTVTMVALGFFAVVAAIVLLRESR